MELTNKVAESGLITINLETYFPREEVKEFDLKNYLYKGLILREKEFRQVLKEHDWLAYTGKVLAVYCSSDAIVPVWAYMLVASNAQPYAAEVFSGSPAAWYERAYDKVISTLDVETYKGERIIIKGCSKKPVPHTAYTMLTTKLQPVAKSVMYGEACSTVPIYKRK